MKIEDAPLTIDEKEKTIAFDLFQRLKDIEEQYTGERTVGDPSPLNLDPSDRRQGTLMAGGDFPEFETYSDVIDAYEIDNMGYDNLTDYINKQNIKIKEIEMSPLADLKKTFKGATGGRVGFYAGSSLADFAPQIKELYLSGEGTPNINKFLNFKGDKTTTIDDLITSMRNPEIDTPIKITPKEFESRPLAIGKNQTGVPDVSKNKLINYTKNFIKKNKSLPSIAELKKIANYEQIKKLIDSGDIAVSPGAESRSIAQSRKGNLEILRLSKDPYIRNIFKSGKTNLVKDIARVKEILGITSDTVAGARLQRLADVFAGESKVDGVKPTFVENAKSLRTKLPYREFIRDMNEQKIGASVGEKSIKSDKSFIRNQPEYKISNIADIDEPAGVKSSVKQGSTPYGIFGQIINKVLNKSDKMRFDSLKSRNEQILNDAIAEARSKGVDIKKDKNVLKAKKRFNDDVIKYEELLNKRTQPGDLKVRLFKVNLNDPSSTIARFKNLPKSYQDAFNKVYKEKGYSFNVPKDIKTIPEIRKIISETPEKFSKGLGRKAAPRMFGINIPLMGYFAQKDFAKGDSFFDIASSAFTGVKPTELLARKITPENKGGYSDQEKIARDKLNILNTIQPSDITTIASAASKDPEYEGVPGKYLDFLKSKKEGIESIALPAEERFQEEVMQPIRDMKIKQRSPIFEGIQSLLNRAGVSGGEIET
jgi:hypothetical protein